MASKKTQPHLATASNRFFRFKVVLFLLFALVLARAAYIIFAQHDYWESVQNNNTPKIDSIQAKRGNIFSDEGLYLASYLPNYEIYLDFKVRDKNEKQRIRYQHELDSAFTANVDSFAISLSTILGGTPASHKKYLVEAHAKRSSSCKIGGRRLTFAQREQVRALDYIRNRRRNRFSMSETVLDNRAHPYGNLGLRTVGELYAGKSEARSGIELGMDTLLRGQNGASRSVKVGKSYIDSIIKAPIDGADIYTTLNMDMQDVCDQVLREKLQQENPMWGGCIVMEVATGDIKALVNLERKQNGQYLEGINRMVSNQLEPGSVFKSVSMLVALDDKRITVESGHDLTGGVRVYGNKQMREHNYYSRGGYSGYHTLPFILGQSSNVGVSSLIYDNYKNNERAFTAGIKRTGILDKFDFAIPGVAQASISDPSSPKWSKTSLPWLSIGYECKIPPIATAAFYNGVANGGKMMAPRLVTKAMRGDEIVYDNPVRVQREHMASPNAIAQLQRCLAYVVDSGLGNKARSEYFTAAGKTGTAQVWEKVGNTNRKLVSFVGYFPADKPLYTVMVTMEGYGLAGGASCCAPVFRQVSEAIMARHIRPSIASIKDHEHTSLPFVAVGNSGAALRVMDALGMGNKNLWSASNHGNTWGNISVDKGKLHFTASQSSTKGRMPNVIGMGAKDALWLLERQGLKVRLQGSGAVIGQSLSAGNNYQAGEVVTLQLGYRHTAPKATKSESEDSSEDTKPSKPEDSPQATPKATDKPKGETKPTEKPKDKPKTEGKSAEKPKEKSKDKPKTDTKPADKPKDKSKEKPKTEVKSADKTKDKPKEKPKPATTKSTDKDKAKKKS